MANVFDSSSAAVGSIQSSLLTEVQFQAIFGTGWVLAKGQSVVGSKYATITGSTTLPDLRGMFLRGKNNLRADGNQNPDGDSAVGAYQADNFKNHQHQFGADDQVQSQGGYTNLGSFQYDATSVLSGGGVRLRTKDDSTNFGTSETRPRNVTVNYFIRIN